MEAAKFSSSSEQVSLDTQNKKIHTFEEHEGRKFTKIASEYSKIKFTPGEEGYGEFEGKSAELMVKKVKVYIDQESGKKLKVTTTKVYVVAGDLGQGSFGKVNSYSSDSGRPKAVKQAETLSQRQSMATAQKFLTLGAKILKEQHVHPKTGEHMKEIPGLMPEVKALYHKKDISLSVMSKFDANIEEKDLKENPQEVSQAAAQLLFGLNHLHTKTKKKKAMVAGDIKGDNILYRTKNGKTSYVLSDLDGAQEAGSSTKPIESPKYVCPEDREAAKDVATHEKAAFDKAKDMYKLGMVLREALAVEGDPIWQLDSSKDKYFKAGNLTNHINTNKSNYTDEKKDNDQAEHFSEMLSISTIIDGMTNSNWRGRLTAENALQSLHNAGVQIPNYSLDEGRE